MTVGGWFIVVFVAACAFCVAAYVICECWPANLKEVAIPLLIAAAVTAAAYFGIHWFLQNTESGKRALKTQQSNFDGGLDRTVTLYSYDGKKLGQWSGEFDVTEDDQEVYFDIDGKRVIIQGGIVINEEN